MELIENSVYISRDSMDCFYFYCMSSNGSVGHGIKVVFWEDGEITIGNKTYDVDVFEEEEPYVLSSKHELIVEFFKD